MLAVLPTLGKTAKQNVLPKIRRTKVLNRDVKGKRKTPCRQHLHLQVGDTLKENLNPCLKE